MGLLLQAFWGNRAGGTRSVVGSSITEQAESRLIFAIHPPPFSIPAVVAATRAPPSDQVAEWALQASSARRSPPGDQPLHCRGGDAERGRQRR